MYKISTWKGVTGVHGPKKRNTSTREWTSSNSHEANEYQNQVESMLMDIRAKAKDKDQPPTSTKKVPYMSNALSRI